MIVVFLTSLTDGHETRFISARTSRRNCVIRPGPASGPLSPRSRRAALPSAPSPKRAALGGTIGASGLSVSAMISVDFVQRRNPALYDFKLAGVPGFEPGLSVLETDVLTVDTIPLQTFPIANLRSPITPSQNNPSESEIGNWQSEMLFRFLMIGVLAATATELAEFKPVGRGLLIFGRNVVSTLTVVTLKHNIIAWHSLISNFRLPISNLRQPLHAFSIGNRQSAIGNRQCFYSTTSETVPAPTVRPPSRIAKRSPFSMAIGAINSISIATLSPGITISTPCGSAATPVTSVVRK
jgi:hypothetical protein